MSLVIQIQTLRKAIPAITLGLALLHALIFWGWQQQDSEKFRKAATFHLESPLYGMESLNFISHLAQQGRAEDAGRIERASDAGDRMTVSLALVTDREFEWGLRKTNEEFWGGSLYPAWRDARERLNAMTARFSTFRWGLSDAEQRPLTFLTHSFLSANVWHWLLTSLGLLFAGTLLERRTGTLTLLLSVIAGGVITGAIALLFDHGGAIPRVGLDGAVGVLMGQLLWLRGKDGLALPAWGRRHAADDRQEGAGSEGNEPPRRVTLRIWMVTLVWLLLELGLSLTDRTLELVRWQALSGLLAGLALARLLSQRLALASDREKTTPTTDREQAFRQALDRALRLQNALDLRGAEEVLSALDKQHPGRGEVLERLAGLRAYLQGPAALREFIPPALDALASSPSQVHAAARLHHLYRRDKGSPPLPQDLLERLLLQAAQRQALPFGKVLAQEAQQQGMVSERLARALSTLADALESSESANAQRIRRQAADTASRLNVVRH